MSGSGSLFGVGDNTVRIWDFQEKSKETVLRGHTDLVSSLAITRDNKFIVSGSKDMTVRLWNLQEKYQVAVMEGHISWVSNVTITHNSKFIDSASKDNSIRVWNLQKVKQEAVLPDQNKISTFIQQIPSKSFFF